jgi:hypothetical protein
VAWFCAGARLWRGVVRCGAGLGVGMLVGWFCRIRDGGVSMAAVAVGSFCAFCVMGRVGGVWRALAGAGARGAVVARGLRGWVVARRMVGPPCYWGCCAFGTTFAHRALEMWIFRGISGGEFLDFWWGGGCARWGSGVPDGCGRRRETLRTARTEYRRRRALPPGRPPCRKPAGGILDWRARYDVGR